MSVKHYLKFPSYAENVKQVTWYPEMFVIGYWTGKPRCVAQQRSDIKEAGVSIWCLEFDKDTEKILNEDVMNINPAESIKLGAVLICKGINAAIHYRRMAKQAKQMRV